MKVRLLVAAAMAGLLGGCEYDEYEIQLTPRGQEIRREIVYNFPEDFVRRDEIRLSQNQQPVEARFKLISLGEVESP